MKKRKRRLRRSLFSIINDLEVVMMARPRSPGRDKAMRLWLESGKKRRLKDIAAELQVSEEQIRKWKIRINGIK